MIAHRSPFAATLARLRSRIAGVAQSFSGLLREQLTQGTSPDRLALTLSVGSVCSLFPFLGLTSLLNLIVGAAFRLNQPILQILNQLLGPIQIALIIPYVRAGEFLWNAQGERFTITDLVTVFRESSLVEFMGRFGFAGLHALSAWLLSVPLIAVVTFYISRPILRRLPRSEGAK